MATVETGAGLARDRLAAVSPAKIWRRLRDMLLLLRWFRLSNCTPSVGRVASNWVRFVFSAAIRTAYFDGASQLTFAFSPESPGKGRALLLQCAVRGD